MSTDVHALLKILASLDQRAAVWCAAQCVRTALHLVVGDERRPQRAVETAEAWVWHEASEDACQKAYRAASAASKGMGVDLSSIHEMMADAHCHASFAAATLNNAAFYFAPSVSGVPSSVAHAVACADPATIAAWDLPDDDDYFTVERQLADAHLVVLGALVRAQRWPKTIPSVEDLEQTPFQAVAVSWDWLADTSEIDLSIPELVEAHRRAVRLGLDWHDPLSRAVAERAVDEESIRALLGASIQPPTD